MAATGEVVNPAIIDRIPLSARVILDVGCGDGALGAEYKRRNPLVRYLGIERDPALAQLAADRLDAVAVADAEREPLPFSGLRYDCIIYNDVLEHLVDPWAVLQAQVPALRTEGCVVLCVPNLEHWSFVECLLRGGWDYQHDGLLDRGHLRWFTLENTKSALEQAGLVPIDVAPVVLGGAQAEAFAGAIAPALRALNIDQAAYLERAAPLQYLWRAARAVSGRLQIVSTMLPPVGGVSHVRVLDPMQALATEPEVVARISDAPSVSRLANSAGIFILHRPALIGAKGLATVSEIVRAGYLAICEFDDHPDFIPILQHPEMHNFSAVHAVQTTTEPLAEVLRRHNPEVAVFANAATRLPDPRNYRPGEPISLFFAGLNRDDEWPPYLDALNEVAHRAGALLRFQIVGDQALFNGLRSPHKQFTPLCDYATYLDLLSSCEISLMPLRDTPFNRCKSDLKFIEAASHRVAALASPVVYAGSIDDGTSGLLFRTPEELRQRLLRLVADPELGRRIADAARGYVAARRMAAFQVADRVGWYRSLWRRRKELHAALLARHPGLPAAIGGGAA